MLPAARCISIASAIAKTSIETESRERHCSKSDGVRERLSLAARSRVRTALTTTIADLVGSVDGLPPDLADARRPISGKRGMAANVLVDAGLQKYADVPMSLADGCLVRMSETLPEPVILTTDRDFRTYRRHGRQVVPCMTPPLHREVR